MTWIALEAKRDQKKITFIKGSIVTVTVVLLSVLAFHFSTVFDFTAERLLTLSDKTKEIVEAVENPTDIYYLGLRSRANATYQELFNQYTSMNDNIKVHYKNIYEDNRFREMYLGDISNVEEASLIVASGKKYVFLDSSDYISTIWTSKYAYKSLLEIENQITSAIAYTNSEKNESLYMIKGHGESDLAPDFLNLLLMNNYAIDSLSLSDIIQSFDTDIPKDCKALIINSPQVDYTEKEIALLKEYIAEGGKLFASIDPLNESFSNLYAFFKEYGLDVKSGVVIEGDETHYILETPYYLVSEMENTEITKQLMKDKLRVLTMTSKGIKKCSPMSGFKVTEVLTTSAQAFSKVENFEKMTTKSENDIMGPFSTAAFSEKNNGGAVFLLTTNLLFEEEVDTDSLGANRKFFLNVINYLTENDTILLIDGKEISNQTALYPNTMLTRIKVVTIIVIPVVILLTGIVVIILRRKNINLTSLKRDRVKENETEE